MNLTIITPMSRPDNFLHLYESIEKNVIPYIDKFKWLVVTDFSSVVEFTNRIPHENSLRFVNAILNNLIEKKIEIFFVPSTDKGLSGNPQRNYALDWVQAKSDSYIYFLDDDNIVHPQLFSTIIGYATGESAIVVNQIWKTGTRRLKADKSMMHVGGADTAQFIIPMYMIGDKRWEPWNYCADGVFFSEVYKDNMDKFIFLDLDISYYNYLR